TLGRRVTSHDQQNELAAFSVRNARGACDVTRSAKLDSPYSFRNAQGACDVTPSSQSTRLPTFGVPFCRGRLTSMQCRWPGSSDSVGSPPKHRDHLALPPSQCENEGVSSVDLGRMTAFLALGLHLAGIAAAGHSIMKTRTSQGAIAWALALIVVPY